MAGQGVYPNSDRSSARIRFGLFELDRVAGVLYKDGTVVKLQPQPTAMLLALLENPGAEVSREDLKLKLWTVDTFVDFDAAIGSCMRKIRQALGDTAENPIFIRTIQRRGFRFIAPVQLVFPSSPRKASAVLTPDLAPPAEPPELRPEGDPAPAEPWPAPERHRAIRVWVAAVTCVAAAGIVLFWGTRPKPPVLALVRPFAIASGQQSHPAFSPRGDIVAFDWYRPQANRQSVYLQRLDATSPALLGSGGANELMPRWSPDGSRVAFLRDSVDRWSIVTLPAIGVEERKWTDFRKGATAWLDWSPDGKWFVFAEPLAPRAPPAVVLFSLATGERRSITSPPAGWRGDSEAVFSPDSLHVAFRRTRQPSGEEDIYVVPLSGGTPQRVTFDNRGISGFAYTHDGGLLFSSLREGTIHSLWWKPPNANRLTRVMSLAVDAVAPAVSSDAKHFAYAKILYDVNIWSVAADGGGAAQSLIDSDLPDTSPAYSPDGRRLAFHSTRSGTGAIWICNADGTRPTMLIDGGLFRIGNPRWSPDGRQLVFEWLRNGHGAIYVAAGEGGNAPRPLVSDQFQNTTPSWSHDGRFIYYGSDRSGDTDVWRVPAQGGPAIQLTAHQGFKPVESPDGQSLCYFHPGNFDLWRIPLANGQPSGPEARVAGPLTQGDWGNWTPVNDGIYYVERKTASEPGEIRFQRFAGGPPRTIYRLQKDPLWGGGGLTISPDGRTILFAQVDRDGSSIFVQ